MPHYRTASQCKADRDAMMAFTYGFPGAAAEFDRLVANPPSWLGECYGGPEGYAYHVLLARDPYWAAMDEEQEANRWNGYDE